MEILDIKYLEVAQKLLSVGKSESILTVYVLYFDPQRFKVCFSLLGKQGVITMHLSSPCSQTIHSSGSRFISASQGLNTNTHSQACWSSGSL